MSAVATTPAATAAKPKVEKVEKPALDAARVAWIVKNARPAVSACLCGCGGTTKGRFMPGHDATLKSDLERTAKGTDKAAKDAKIALGAFGW